MVIDTSAIAAILFCEPDRKVYEAAIAGAGGCSLSAVTRVEAALVVEGRKGELGRAALEQFLSISGAQVAAVTGDQAMIAIEAFRRFGKGRHPAGLNLGDCFAYALARATGQPLLFKGDDFRQTDILPAV